MTRKATLPILLAGLVLVAACKDDRSPTAPDAMPASPDMSAAPPFSFRSIDEEFAFLAREKIPGGFGGWFYDQDGKVNVYLTDLTRRQMAVKALIQVLQHRSVSLRGRSLNLVNIKVHQGQFDFVRLKAWSELLPEILALPEVVSTDIDETRNRLRLGVQRGVAISRIESELTRLGIPRAAVVIEEDIPFDDFQANTVRGRERPTTAGLATGPIGPCTMGPNVRLGFRFFFSPSHCTRYRGGGFDDTPFYQPFETSGNYIGYEWSDPAFMEEVIGCPPGRRCRHSDAAMIIYHDTVAWDFGTIVRTRGSSRTEPGSLEIDPIQRRLFIRSEKPYPEWGEVLDKIGQETGWTWGTVVVSCRTRDLPDSDLTYLCEDHMDAVSDHGDSGAPVFGLAGGNDVKIYGILVAGNRAENRYVFHSIYSLRQDHGYQFSMF
jgi:hypothetical protein